MNKLYSILIFCFFSLSVSHCFCQIQDDKSSFQQRLSAAAIERTGYSVAYDGRYFSVAYPGGDIPKHLGVCTDVVIRSYRSLGIDLQKAVHEDMRDNFSEYPNHWGLKKTDSNIDHRRVLNLEKFFSRKGKSLTVTDKAEDYVPGDLVTWLVNSRLPHIGIVVDRKSADGKRYLIIHNIGHGPELEDVLFAFPITGHYRYEG